jgi:PAS domain S-box-containing protein
MNLNIFQWRSLKTRVTLFTLAIFVISIWSLAFYVSRMLREDMQRLLGEQQFSTVSFVAAEINEGLKLRIKALEEVARSIDQPLIGSPAALQQMLDNRPILVDLFNSGVVVVTLDGTAVADAPVVSNRRGTNYFNNEATHIALTEGKTVIGRPVVGRVLHEPLFNINTPIRNADGKIIGALFGVINLAKPNFLDRIGEHHYGRTGGYLLIAPQYRLIVTATDRSRIMQPLPAPGVNPQIDRFVQGYEGYAVYVNAVGVEILNSVKAIPVAGWYLAANLPTAEAFAPIQDMQRRVLIAAIILTLLAGALTWWMLKRQLAPMLTAAKTLAAMQNTSQPPQPLPIATQDEIGELIGGFNRLLETLRQREEALEWERQEQWRTILRTAMDGFWLADTQGRLLEVNEAYCRMSGYSAQELLATRIADLETNEAADETAAHMQEIVAMGEDRFESRHRRKDGSIFDVEVSVKYRTVNGGRFVAFIQNITERKHAERELRRSQQELRGLSKAANEALEAERRRTARELHDELGQSLTALKMDLESLHSALPPNQPDLAKRAQAMHAILDSTIAATRRIATDLRPLMLDDLGLAAALDWLTHNFSKRTGIATDLVVDNTVAQVPEPIASSLYRITQESLTNVTKYAQATATEIRLERDGDWVQLTVRDNGCGIEEADQSKRGAFGLLGMRERVMLLSGEIAIRGEPGRGSEVRVRIPLAAEEAQ